MKANQTSAQLWWRAIGDGNPISRVMRQGELTTKYYGDRLTRSLKAFEIEEIYKGEVIQKMPVTQTIPLPEEIVANVFAPFDGKIQKYNMETAVVKIKDYAREVAIVAIILSDNYMKELYEKSQSGYIACIDQLQAWATEFVKLYAHVEEWEEFCNTQTLYKNIMCWDDFVIAYGADKMKKY